MSCARSTRHSFTAGGASPIHNSPLSHFLSSAYPLNLQLSTLNFSVSPLFVAFPYVSVVTPLSTAFTPGWEGPHFPGLQTFRPSDLQTFLSVPADPLFSSPYESLTRNPCVFTTICVAGGWAQTFRPSDLPTFRPANVLLRRGPRRVSWLFLSTAVGPAYWSAGAGGVKWSADGIAKHWP